VKTSAVDYILMICLVHSPKQKQQLWR